MKLVTFGDEPRVGVLEGGEIAVLDVPSMRAYFERGGADETGERVALAETRLRAPIVPKKFFHTAGNFREHEEESKRVGWAHEIAPWIVFFQNVDAIIGPDEPVIYPEHLTEELDYELELAVVVIDDLKPDIIHTHRYKEILLGALLSGRRAPRHIVTIHGYEPPTRLLARWRTFLSNSFCIGAALLQGARFIVVADPPEEFHDST